MANDEVTLTIDGKTVTAPKGTMVVDAAKRVGIDIPVFCYHEKLGPFGCCRMCLVEVEKMPKMATACTLAVAPDMVVKTNTEKVEKAQKGVLEFTLLNHPLDCPVCDKGGECPLQENTFKFGSDDTRMEFNRSNQDKATPLSPVITIDRERCIACQRCTRYSDIIEQEQALVMLNRGFNNEVGTFDNQDYDTKFSGNVIDICPVGALTNTDFRFKARNWELKTADTLCAHCACNCNMTFSSRLNKFMRIQTRTNDHVDDGWICDKARFGYSFVESKNRILQARSRFNGEERVLETKDAIALTAQTLKKIADEHGPESIGFIGSPYATNEEAYLYQLMFRQGLKTNNIDHKAYEDLPGLPINHYDFDQVESSNLVLLIGSDPSEELPILDLRIRKAVTRKGVKLAFLNDQATALDRFAESALRYDVGSDGDAIDALASGLAQELGIEKSKGKSKGKEKDKIESACGIADKDMKALVELVRTSMKICVIYNPASLSAGSMVKLRQLLQTIGKIPTVECGAIPAAPATNALGAVDMGLLPAYYPGGLALADADEIKKRFGEDSPLQAGLSAMDMIAKAESGELKALLVHRSNPVADFPGGERVASALKKLEFLAVHDMLETETTRLASVVLPSIGPGYDEGTTTNIGARVQYRKRGLSSEILADWHVISKMAGELGIERNYQSSFSVTAEISEKVRGYEDISKKTIKKEGLNRQAIPEVLGDLDDSASNESKSKKGALRLRVASYLFANDKILDANTPLGHHFRSSTVHLNDKDAKKMKLEEGDAVTVSSAHGKVSATVAVGDRCNSGSVVIERVSDEQGVSALQESTGISWVDISKD
jgi:NADH-quinone oxidoreductase subunit G